MRLLSELHLESNDDEDGKEEEEPSMSWRAMEHAMPAGLCDKDIEDCFDRETTARDLRQHSCMYAIIQPRLCR